MGEPPTFRISSLIDPVKIGKQVQFILQRDTCRDCHQPRSKHGGRHRADKQWRCPK